MTNRGYNVKKLKYRRKQLRAIGRTNIHFYCETTDWFYTIYNDFALNKAKLLKQVHTFYHNKSFIFGLKISFSFVKEFLIK